MYPNEGRLTVQVVLGRAQVAKAVAMRLPAGISKVLRAAKDYPEGRWLFVPVSSPQSAREIRMLIELKLASPTAKSTGGHASRSSRDSE